MQISPTKQKHTRLPTAPLQKRQLMAEVMTRLRPVFRPRGRLTGPSASWRDTADARRHGKVRDRHGTARHGKVRYGTERYGTVWHSPLPARGIRMPVKEHRFIFCRGRLTLPGSTAISQKLRIYLSIYLSFIYPYLSALPSADA